VAESRQRGFQVARRNPDIQSGRLVHLKPELGSDLERQVLAVKERRGLYPEAVVVLISVDILADRSGRGAVVGHPAGIEAGQPLE